MPSQTTLVRSLFLCLFIIKVRCVQISDKELIIQRGLRYKQPVNTNYYSDIKARRSLEDFELNDDDIICQNVFYVVVENEEGDSQDSNVWVCDIEKEDGRYHAFRLVNIPTQANEELKDDIQGISGNAQLILRQAVSYLDESAALINLPTETGGEDVIIEIIKNEEAQQQIMFNEKTVLVIRVTGSEPGEELKSADGVIIDASTLSRRVFGGSDDKVNLKTQYEDCSANQLIIERADGYNAILSGVLDVDLDVSTSHESSKPLVDGTNEFLENKIVDAAKAKLGISTTLESEFDIIMMCLPEGTNVKTAYARLLGKRSVYSGESCIMPSYQMHEIGHSLGLYHSNHNGREYDDKSGIMGFSYPDDHEFPRMCFNGAKSAIFGWYFDKSVNHDPDPQSLERSKTFNLVGVTDYISANRFEHTVVITLKGIRNDAGVTDPDVNTNYYILYNLAEGFNSETQEFANQVTITKGQVKTVNNQIREQTHSSHISALLLGQNFEILDYKGSGVNLMIKFCGENRDGDPATAEVIIFFTSEDDPCPSITGPPTPAPTSSPGERPSCKIRKILSDIIGAFITVTIDI